MLEHVPAGAWRGVKGTGFAGPRLDSRGVGGGGGCPKGHGEGLSPLHNLGGCRPRDGVMLVSAGEAVEGANELAGVARPRSAMAGDGHAVDVVKGVNQGAVVADLAAVGLSEHGPAGVNVRLVVVHGMRRGGAN